MEIDFFWNVTYPIVLMLLGIIITLVITLIIEVVKLRGIGFKLNAIKEGVDTLNKKFDDRIGATIQDFSRKIDNVIDKSFNMAKPKGNPNPNPNSECSDEGKKKKNKCTAGIAG